MMKTSLQTHVEKVISIKPQEMNEFLGLFTETRLHRKELLIKPGDTVDKEYYVVKGCLKAYFEDVQGEKHIIQFAIEDWWISDFEAFFSDAPAKLYIEAIEDCVLLGINKSILETLYSRIPKFERFFRIKTTNAFLSLRKRISASLEKTAAAHYLDFCQTYPKIEKRVNNYHIANYLGIKAESLSRIRKQLEVSS